MGSFPRRLANAFVVLALINASADGAWNKGEKRDVKLEDAGFWDRILEDVASSIASAEPSSAPPTPSPVTVTSAPSKAPTRSPVVLTSAPTGAPTRSPVTLTSAPTRAPTRSPVTLTSAPTRAPTGSPVILTSAPTSAPTMSPVVVTAAPTTAPVVITPPPVIETSPPTASPTGAPIEVPSTPPPVPITIAPVEDLSDSPSLSPTAGQSPDSTLAGCFLEAAISCLNGNGIPCTDLVPPSGQCSVGADIQIINFVLLPSTCEESRNSQGNNFGCFGVEAIPPEETAVVVSCEDSDGSEFFGESTSIGSSVTIQDTVGAGLPNEIICTITETDSGDQLQTVTINTGGIVDLFLADTYGMFEVVSCEVEGQPLQTCNIPILYTYLLENTGPEPLNVTALQRTRDGVTVDLFELVEGANPLLPGDSVSTAETEVIDICIDGLYETSILTAADPLEESPCEDVATYVFEIENNCRIDITIECSSENGTPCDALGQLVTVCPDEDFESLTFRYQSRACTVEDDTCTDSNGGLTGDEILVSCTGSDDTAIGEPVLVENEETFTISQTGGFAAELTCTLSSLNDTVLQIVSVVVSDTPLKAEFGGLTLEGCVDGEGGALACETSITWIFEAINLGPNSLNLTLIEIARGDIVIDLSDQIIDSELAPGESSEVLYQEVVDRCLPADLTTVALAEAELSCVADDAYELVFAGLPTSSPTAAPIEAPTTPATLAPSAVPSQPPVNTTSAPTPDPETAACEVEAAISCAYADGLRCDLQSPVGVTCSGETVATFLQFAYDPSSSCMGDNAATNFECEDFNLELDRPPSVYVMLGGNQDGDVWYMGEVTEGQIIDVPTNRGDAMRIEISTVAEGGAGELLQESVMNFDCTEESALTLLNYFGNLQMLGFQNAESGLQQVFANIEITYTATNAGVLEMDLFGAVGSSPFSGFQDFLSGEVRTLSRNEDAVFVEQFTLNLEATAGSDFQFTFLAQGRGSSSEVGCDDTDAFTLSIGA